MGRDKVFKTSMITIMSNKIKSDTRYQRELDMSRVKKIVKQYNPNLVNEPKVSKRDGLYYVFDGQHTIKVLEMMNHGNPVLVTCKVFEGLTVEDEAILFSEQNGLEKIPKTSDKFKALYFAKDIDVVSMKNAIEKSGVRCDFTNGKGKNKVCCYKSVYKIYMNYGDERLTRIMNLIRDAWDGEDNSFCKEIIEGLNIFIEKYDGLFFDYDLVKSLSPISPIQIIRDGKLSSSPGSKKYAECILRQYNKRRSTKKLEGSFI